MSDAPDPALTPQEQAWIDARLAEVGPLTQEQQAELRRVLLPPKPLPKPA